MRESKILKGLETTIIGFDSIEDALGPNYQTVINFWLFVESLDKETLDFIGKDYRNHTYDYDTETKIVGILKQIIPHEGRLWQDIVDVVKVLVGETFTFSRNKSYAITWATHEIIGMHKLIEIGHDFRILKLF